MLCVSWSSLKCNECILQTQWMQFETINTLFYIIGIFLFPYLLGFINPLRQLHASIFLLIALKVCHWMLWSAPRWVHTHNLEFFKILHCDLQVLVTESFHHLLRCAVPILQWVRPFRAWQPMDFRTPDWVGHLSSASFAYSFLPHLEEAKLSAVLYDMRWSRNVCPSVVWISSGWSSPIRGYTDFQTHSLFMHHLHHLVGCLPLSK